MATRQPASLGGEPHAARLPHPPLTDVSHPDLLALGWEEHAPEWDERASTRAAASDDEPRPARVTEAQRGFARLRGAGAQWLAPVPGPLRGGPVKTGEPGPPVTGDWVLASPDEPVREILPRRSLLRRYDETAGSELLVANADLAIIVSSLNQDLNASRLERLLAIADEGGVPRLLALSKRDLHPDPEQAAERLSAELQVETLSFSSRTGAGVPELVARLVPRHTTVLLGSSGVGKSTLVNTLLGEERQKTLNTRAGDDRGRHATTSRTLLRLPSGALLVDTPGLRSPRPASADALEETFPDVAAVTSRCRFGDCSHLSEPGCAVREAIAAGELDARRLESMGKLRAELEDALGRAEDERRRSRGRPPAPAPAD